MLDTMTKNVFKRSLILSIIIIAAMLLFLGDPMKYIRGYLFGFLVGNLTFRLLVNSSKKASKMHPASAEGYATKQYMIRMVIYFIVMVIASYADYLDIFATFIGLISIKIIILVSTIFKWEL